MKVKIFNGLCSKTYPQFEKEINNFLSNFVEIKKISFTQLQNNIVLCCYEGITKEDCLKIEAAKLKRRACEDAYLQELLRTDLN